MPSPRAVSYSTAPRPRSSSASEGARDRDELAFRELSARRSRQRVEHLEPFGPELLADAAAGEVLVQRVECQAVRAGAQLDEHADALAEGLVAHRDGRAQR